MRPSRQRVSTETSVSVTVMFGQVIVIISRLTTVTIIAVMPRRLPAPQHPILDGATREDAVISCLRLLTREKAEKEDIAVQVVHEVGRFS